jgi:hypothetical protein
MKCSVCNSSVIIYPDPPGKAYCPDHCPDHDYYYEYGDGWMCKNCGTLPEFDSYLYDN